MGAPLVGFLAEQMGFSDKDGPKSDLEKAEALGTAMLVATAVPWALCALIYTGEREKIGGLFLIICGMMAAGYK
jgi:hypothetical protein